MRKEKQMKVTYHYIEPKTEEEAREQQRNVDAAYDILFEAVLRHRNSQGRSKLKQTPNSSSRATPFN